MAIPRILIIDDEEKNVRLMKGMLMPEKFQLFECFSGADALETVYATRPDLILLDILMPEVNGFEVCAQLKKDDRTLMIPIIMVTAMQEIESRKEAMDAGADDFLTKPVERAKLIVRVKSNLRIKSYHDDLIASHAKISKKNEELRWEILERKRTEAALRQSEEKYRHLVNHAPAGIYEMNIAKATFISVNDILCDYTGYTREELLGLYPLDLFAEESREDAIYRHRNMESGLAASEISEYKIKRRDGSELWAILNSKITCEEGVPQRATVVVHDITKLKEAEEERSRLQKQLLQAQKMEVVAMVAGGVAHDLNNILSGVLTYPELLLMNLPQGSPLKKPIETIWESGKKAAAIVQDLLTLARRGVAVSEPVNLNDIVSEYLSSPECEKLKVFHHQVDIWTDLAPDLLNVSGSPVHLSKTVMNLVSNAAEAMPNGGTLAITTQNRYIDRPVRGYDEVQEGDYAVLDISDTGVGISVDDLDQIFEPFYTKKVMGRSGTGLGMAVVWGTVKDHKGYIQVKSKPEHGSTFTLYFPVSRTELRKDHPMFSMDDYKGRKESILVIDDMREQREIASSILTRLGYSVKTVPSGEAAITYLKNQSADLLLLDMIMDPGLDGLETYEQILRIHPEQKAIITSGFSETDRVKKVQQLGAGDYIKKPYTIEKISSAIKSALDSGLSAPSSP